MFISKILNLRIIILFFPVSRYLTILTLYLYFFQLFIYIHPLREKIFQIKTPACISPLSQD